MSCTFDSKVFELIKSSPDVCSHTSVSAVHPHCPILGPRSPSAVPRTEMTNGRYLPRLSRCKQFAQASSAFTLVPPKKKLTFNRWSCRRPCPAHRLHLRTEVPAQGPPLRARGTHRHAHTKRFLFKPFSNC